MRDYLRLAMLGWVTAVLLCSPVLAGASCWQCCGPTERAALTAQALRPAAGTPLVQADCAHCRVALKDLATSPSDTRRDLHDGSAAEHSSHSRPCDRCPKCSSSRPSPADRPGVVDPRAGDPLLTLAVLDPVLTSSRAPEVSERRDHLDGLATQPSRQKLFCSWLK